MINTVKVTQDLIDVGFTHRQAAAVAKVLEDAARDVLAEFDRRCAERHNGTADLLAEANGAIAAECDRLMQRLALFERMDEDRHSEAVARIDALHEKLVRQLSDTEQRILQKLSELEQSLTAQLFALSCEITVKAAAITKTVHATGMAMLSVVGLAALAVLVLI